MSEAPYVSGPGDRTPAQEFGYRRHAEPMVWTEENTYAGEGAVASPTDMSWNHGLGEIVMAVLDAGLRLESPQEHDSAPWSMLPQLMTAGPDGEYRLDDRPDPWPATFTLVATKPSA